MGLICAVSKKELMNGLGNLQNVTKKGGTIAILSNVLIESINDGLILTGTDLEVGLKITIPAQIHEQGTITIPSKKFFEIVRESGDEYLKIKVKENNWVEIIAGNSDYNLPGMASEDFPEFPKFNQEGMIEMNAYVFSELIEKTMYALAGETENVYSLTSILFEKEIKDGLGYLRMISSDGHRLSIMEKDVDAEIDKLNLNEVTLIPKKGIQELRKFCEKKDRISVCFEENKMVLVSPDSIMIIRLQKGQFPLYRAIVDTVQIENPINIERIPFLESLKRINIFTDDVYHMIQISIENNKIILTSQNEEEGTAKDELEVIYQDEPLKLGFNCRYFIDTLQVMESDRINAYINNNESPCLIQSDDDAGFISVIMPMHI